FCFSAARNRVAGPRVLPPRGRSRRCRRRHWPRGRALTLPPTSIQRDVDSGGWFGRSGRGERRGLVRRLERQYFAAVLAPLSEPEPDPDWARWLAADLRVPRFRISMGGALTRRLKRNYIWMYLILLLSWAVKIT